MSPRLRRPGAGRARRPSPASRRHGEGVGACRRPGRPARAPSGAWPVAEDAVAAYSCRAPRPIVIPAWLADPVTCRCGGRRAVEGGGPCSGRGRRLCLAGTPVRSGRTPVIIITWLGMVSITTAYAASGAARPPHAARARVGVSSGHLVGRAAVDDDARRRSVPRRRGARERRPPWRTAHGRGVDEGSQPVRPSAATAGGRSGGDVQSHAPTEVRRRTRPGWNRQGGVRRRPGDRRVPVGASR